MGDFTEDSGVSTSDVVAEFTTSDADGDTVTVTLSDTTNYVLGTGADAGKVFLTNAGLALVNAGSDLPAFTLTPNDGTVDGTAGNADPSVTPVNDAPTVESAIGQQDLTEDFTTYTIDLKNVFADEETSDASLTYTVSGNTNIGVSISNGVATISAATADWNGTETLTFTASDGDKSVSDTADFVVSAVADIASDGPTTVAEDTATVINVLSNDGFENSGALVTSVGSAANGGTVVVSNSGANVTYTPASGYTGTDSFTYTVTSGGVTETATVTVNVSAAPNNAPTVSAISETVNEDASSFQDDLLTDASANDADGDTVTVSGTPTIVATDRHRIPISIIR